MTVPQNMVSLIVQPDAVYIDNTFRRNSFVWFHEWYDLLLQQCPPENFLVQGVKINTPHYLAKLEQVPRGTSTYTVIVSQLESLTTIYYTLRVCTVAMLGYKIKIAICMM